MTLRIKFENSKQKAPRSVPRCLSDYWPPVTLYVISLDLNGDVIEGDEVETEMFKYSNHKLDSQNINKIRDLNNDHTLTKVKVFQFSAVKKKMSRLIRCHCEG